MSAARESIRVRRAKHDQAFDPDPPRCGNCVFFNRGSAKKRRESAKRGWTLEKARIAADTNWSASDLTRCTFGNFRVNNMGVCDEWRGKDGTRLQGIEEPTKTKDEK